jgi:RNA polymerase sigma-70 factor (ECF subfamily)
VISTFIKSAAQPKEDRRQLFECLMRDSHRHAFSLAMRLTGNTAEAEDLCQESFLRAFRFFHRYDETLPFTSWLYRIMTNAHIDSVRRKGRLRTTSLDQSGLDGNTTWEIADENASPEVPLMNRELDEPLQLGLLAMSPDFRMAVLLADVEGMAYEEIAEVMQTSIGTVRSRIHRGRRQLREYLRRSCPDRFKELSSEVTV